MTKGIDAAQPITLELTAEEFALIEGLLQDYANKLRHAARLDVDLTGDQKSAQRHMEEAGEIDQLREKVTRAELAQRSPTRPRRDGIPDTFPDNVG